MPIFFRRTLPRILFVLALIVLPVMHACAQESPYFVTYDHHLEEPGNFEIATQTTFGLPHSPAPNYIAPLIEMEYGVKAWWTTELYLESQSTRGDSSIFTGWRLENRFRPLKREHFVNPVLYFEYESINEASRIQKEVVGHADPAAERASNAEARAEHAHELEGKLILSSTVHDWNVSENVIVEKNLTHNEGLEFGYALGLSRPLSRMASAKECRLCRENFSAGMELYGGLGSTQAFGFAETAHYLAPILQWRMSDSSEIRVSPGFGLTNVSERMLLRVGYSYEVRGLRNKVAGLFRGKDKNQVRDAKAAPDTPAGVPEPTGGDR